MRAADALEKIDDPSAVPGLLEVLKLKDEDEDVREAAAWALEKILPEYEVRIAESVNDPFRPLWWQRGWQWTVERRDYLLGLLFAIVGGVVGWLGGLVWYLAAIAIVAISVVSVLGVHLLAGERTDSRQR